MAKQARMEAKNFFENGRTFIDAAKQGSAAGRALSNISLINRMLNPGIWVSGFIEIPVRMTFESVTDYLTGEKLGAGGKKIAQVGEKIGVRTRHTPQQVELLNRLAEELGSNRLFLKEVENEITFRVLALEGEVGNGWLQRALEKSAGTLASAMSNPRYGMTGAGVARQYIGAAYETLLQQGTVISVEQFVRLMSDNPMWLKDNFPYESGRYDPHTAGMARIGQIRSLKPTILSKMIMAPTHALLTSDGQFTNFMGYLTYIPLMFTNFNVNMLTTMTGMGGWDQAIAMFFSGRKRPNFLSGKNNKDGYWDLTDVIETMDIQRTFIKSGVTATMVFTLGLMMGGIAGEDDEAKRRRRMAQYLGIPNYLDPTERQNSFLLKDAFYLNQIPVIGHIFDDENGDPTDAPFIPHWVLRQFTSPLQGISRFFETGDFRDVSHGFWDAYQALPTATFRMWDQVDQLAGALVEQAHTEAGGENAQDNPDAMASAMQLLITAVSLYERLLLENSTINSMVQAADQFDRNPYIQVATTESGGIKYGPDGEPLPSEVLTDELGPNGEKVSRYERRPDGALYQYAESNAVISFLATLVTGGWNDSPFNRQNMAIRQEYIQAQSPDPEKMKSLIWAAYMGQENGGSFQLNERDVIGVLKGQYEAAGKRWNQADIEAQAQAFLSTANIAEYSLDSGIEALKDLNELQKNAEDRALVEGLARGTLTFKSPVFQDWSLTQEERDKMGAEIYRDLVQDAVNLGVSNEAAQFIAGRVFNGDKTVGSEGIADFLYSNDIPSSPVLKYRQQNATYTLGPDGKPWATPFAKTSVLGALGIPIPRTPLNPGPGMALEEETLKSVDVVTGINTGLHALVRQPGQQVEQPKELPQVGDIKPTREGLFARTYRRRGGYGGGSYGGSGPFFQRMDRLPVSYAPRVDDIPFINTNNPFIRRSRVNTERVTSDRGRLKQWQ